MPTSKSSPSRKKTAAPRKPKATVKPPRKLTLREKVLKRLSTLRIRRQNFLARRPHRAFRRTKRRDYTRSLKLPGYYAFTLKVAVEIKQHWKIFIKLAVLYALLLIVIGGVTSQDSYTQVSDLLQQSSSTLSSGGWDKLGQASLLLVATFARGPSDLTTDQQIYLFVTLLFLWLSTVWLLREFKLGRKPRLRDGLYNSSAPFISTLLVLVTLVCQLLPIGIVALVYSALSSVGIVSEGFGSMIFWVLAAIVMALVMYWVTSTIIALVVVTLPGMYPMRAIRAASDLVVSRRLRIMYRILWAMGVIVVVWALVMIPLILLTTSLTSVWAGMANIPVMPFAAALMSALTAVWMASYVYLLYRKVVDDDAEPA